MKIYNILNNKIKQRFFNKIEIISNGCYNWIGATVSGYGSFSIYNKTTKAHRVAWIITNNQEIPDGLCVLHTCDNKLCVNPEHLFLGTFADNNKDMMNKGRYINGNLKLIENDVTYIYKLHDEGFTNKYIANLYNMHISTIQGILSGRFRKDIFNKNKRFYYCKHLSKEEILDIYRRSKLGESNVAIAKVHNISPTGVSSIKLGKKHIKLFKEFNKEVIL